MHARVYVCLVKDPNLGLFITYKRNYRHVRQMLQGIYGGNCGPARVRLKWFPPYEDRVYYCIILYKKYDV